MAEKVLWAEPFLSKDSKWKGAVEVVERTLEDGTVHINLRLRRGRHSVYLPRRSTEEICAAITAASVRAGEEYKKLIKAMNQKE